MITWLISVREGDWIGGRLDNIIHRHLAYDNPHGHGQGPFLECLERNTL